MQYRQGGFDANQYSQRAEKTPVCQAYPCPEDHKKKIFRTPGVGALGWNRNNMDSIIPFMNIVEHPPWTSHKTNVDVQDVTFPLGLGFLICKRF